MELKVISLFSGAMGLDLGFEKAGFEIRVALDLNRWACETIKLNRPTLPVIHKNVRNVQTKEILEKAGLGIGEATLVIGGPPCQPFSTAGNRSSINHEKGSLIFEFLRVVREARPQFFVFENVTGLLSAALKHMSFYERISKKVTELQPDVRLGSAFEVVLDRFLKTGYYITWEVLNAADYGTPQKRKRLFIFGSRDKPKLQIPPKTHAPKRSLDVSMGLKKPWTTVKDAFRDLVDPDPEYINFPSWGKYMKYIPPGGDWRDLPKEIKEEAMGGAFKSQGGRTGYYRRLDWEKPSPTILTSPVFKGTVLAHPDKPRPLSIKEYAKIQCFPDNWEFAGKLRQKYRLIGEAVPVRLSYAIAKSIKEHIQKGVLTNAK